MMLPGGVLGQRDMSSPHFGVVAFSCLTAHSPPSGSCHLDGTSASPLLCCATPSRAPKTPWTNTLRLALRLGYASLPLHLGSPPPPAQGTRSHVPKLDQNTEAAASPLLTPGSPTQPQGCVHDRWGAPGAGGSLGSPWEGRGSHSIFLLLSSPPVPDRTVTSLSVASPQAVTPKGASCGCSPWGNRGSKSRPGPSPSPRPAGWPGAGRVVPARWPTAAPTAAGGGSSRGWGPGGIRLPRAPARLSASSGTWGREARRGWSLSPTQAEGCHSRTPGCTPPPPYPSCSPAEEDSLPWAGRPLAQERLRNPRLLPDPGARGGPVSP